MIIRILFFCIEALLGGVLMHCDDYSSIVPGDKIKELPMRNVLYKTEYVDYDYRGFGTYENPQIVCEIRYDTLSHFRVIVWGYVILSDIDQANTQIVDSVAITKMIVLRKHHKPVRFSRKRTAYNSFDKPWRECPLPWSVRNEIREDFLVRMKYRKYHINEKERRITVYHEYKLYESD